MSQFHWIPLFKKWHWTIQNRLQFPIKTALVIWNIWKYRHFRWAFRHRRYAAVWFLWFRLSVTITYADGSTMTPDCKNSSISFTDQSDTPWEYNIDFDEPIAPEGIVSIEFGGTTIPFHWQFHRRHHAKRGVVRILFPTPCFSPAGCFSVRTKKSPNKRSRILVRMKGFEPTLF